MYVAFSEFEKYKRSSDTNINTYISDFDRPCNKVKVHKVEYPDALLGYKLQEKYHFRDNDNSSTMHWTDHFRGYESSIV